MHCKIKLLYNLGCLLNLFFVIILKLALQYLLNNLQQHLSFVYGLGTGSCLKERKKITVTSDRFINQKQDLFVHLPTTPTNSTCNRRDWWGWYSALFAYVGWPLSVISGRNTTTQTWSRLAAFDFDSYIVADICCCIEKLSDLRPSFLGGIYTFFAVSRGRRLSCDKAKIGQS